MSIKYFWLLFVLSIAVLYPLDSISAKVVCHTNVVLEKAPPIKKKKQKLRKKRKFKNKKFLKQEQLQNSVVERFLLIVGSVVVVVGIVMFIVGAVLLNPLIWIIGLSTFFLIIMSLYVYIWIDYNSVIFTYVVFFSIASSILGLALLIIGLVLQILVLWIGGIVFMTPLLLLSLLIIKIIIAAG